MKNKSIERSIVSFLGEIEVTFTFNLKKIVLKVRM